MTKTDMLAMINNLPASELQELQAAIKAKSKLSKKEPNKDLLQSMRGAVELYGYKQLQLTFGIVRKEHVAKVKADRAAKAAKKADKPTKTPAPAKKGK